MAFWMPRQSSFMAEFKERLHSSFMHGRSNHLDKSTNLGIYATYKDFFVRENYVDCISVECYRTALAQFRMGVSQIYKHRFRFSPSDENWRCPVCKSVNETETHFMFVCPAYTDIREKYLPPIRITDLDHLLVIILKSTSSDTIMNVAKFICLAFERRSNMTVTPKT